MSRKIRRTILISFAAMLALGLPLGLSQSDIVSANTACAKQAADGSCAPHEGWECTLTSPPIPDKCDPNVHCCVVESTCP